MSGDLGIDSILGGSVTDTATCADAAESRALAQNQESAAHDAP
jgi:hypothetical protein